MRIVEFGNIKDAISSGQRAEARINSGPILSAPTSFASLQFGSSDFAAASIASALNRPSQFVWSVSRWGDPQAKVTD